MKQREIKFRLWDKENKIMVLSDDQILGEGASFDIGSDGSTHCIYNRSFYPNIKDKTELAHANSSECILMQFTGLHDKEGKDIYEFDIVTDEQHKHIVEWEEEIAKFQATVLKRYLRCGCTIKGLIFSNQFTIIGNKFENPELIKKKCG